ncbi:MaoC family dehydratase [Rhizobium rhizogenes]|uniref:MaoC family dehydratase n=1 Tax=Rhizobium rhizogenes TaxID=359 RepID=UPI0006483EAA|nr:MaoC family dehydratase [Rhizobium rhizogenes]MDJ1635809.1 MaoC family dehydratase [Rhizobium rhizogenes]NTG74314.1 MaoC family dehydratase [Rhizobium rhizogenes]
MKMMELYPTGERAEIGSHTFTAENIVHFASRFDPQIFHMDAEAAKETLFGGLCASGWHTCAAWMRTFIDYWKGETARLIAEGGKPPKLGPSAGFQKLQWLRPVFAGDTVTYGVTLLSSRPLASRSGWTLSTILCDGTNQHGVPVIRFESTVLEFE